MQRVAELVRFILRLLPLIPFVVDSVTAITFRLKISLMRQKTDSENFVLIVLPMAQVIVSKTTTKLRYFKKRVKTATVLCVCVSYIISDNS